MAIETCLYALKTDATVKVIVPTAALDKAGALVVETLPLEGLATDPDDIDATIPQIIEVLDRFKERRISFVAARDLVTLIVAARMFYDTDENQSEQMYAELAYRHLANNCYLLS